MVDFDDTPDPLIRINKSWRPRYTIEIMNSTIPNFSTASVLVIGDVMLDRYWQGSTARISPEAPVPIVHITHQQERPGGAGNVALNITALGARAILIGVTGDDAAAANVQAHLTTNGVRCAFLRLPNVPTITKLRVLSRHQQLLRLDFEEAFTGLTPSMLVTDVRTYLPEVDVVLLSDYGKGTLVDPQTLIQHARAAGKPVLIDPKGRDFSKYHGATLITPNLAEFEAIVGHCSTLVQLVEKGENLRAQLALDALLITRGEQGMTLLQREQPAVHLSAQAHEVFDVTGAGDTVISVVAASLAAHQNLVQATTLANVAAGLVVAKLGAATVTVPELEQALQAVPTRGIYDAPTLQSIVQAAKARGEKIVMTNGCFDILHAGHIHYLTQARQLGQRLLVAVNDDASVKRLKGPHRPLNGLAERLAVLSALACVDWVVPFATDTPAELICQLKPDILVKGGDYRGQPIAGSECVLANGGQVLVLDFVEGYSTTAMIASWQREIS